MQVESFECCHVLLSVSVVVYSCIITAVFLSLLQRLLSINCAESTGMLTRQALSRPRPLNQSQGHSQGQGKATVLITKHRMKPKPVHSLNFTNAEAVKHVQYN